MKFATIASICLAATAAPRFANGAGFDELMALVEQLNVEATALSTKYGGMEAEVTSLIDQLTRCEGGGGGWSGRGLRGVGRALACNGIDMVSYASEACTVHHCGWLCFPQGGN